MEETIEAIVEAIHVAFRGVPRGEIAGEPGYVSSQLQEWFPVTNWSKDLIIR